MKAFGISSLIKRTVLACLLGATFWNSEKSSEPLTFVLRMATIPQPETDLLIGNLRDVGQDAPVQGFI